MSALSGSVDSAVLRDLAPKGVLRAAINFGNHVLAQRDGDGARGVSVDLAHELGRRLGVGIELVSYDAAGKVVDALQDEAWDIAFLAIDPKRATEILFSPPYVQIEGAYLVRENSPLTRPEEVDCPGIRVAAGDFGDRRGAQSLARGRMTVRQRPALATRGECRIAPTAAECQGNTA